jgi:hypothetical protein
MMTISRRTVAFSVKLLQRGITLQHESCWIDERRDDGLVPAHSTLAASGQDAEPGLAIKSDE